MRNPGVSSPIAEQPLHRHPAIARWMAELRRQQRRAERAREAAVSRSRPATR